MERNVQSQQRWWVTTIALGTMLASVVGIVYVFTVLLSGVLEWISLLPKEVYAASLAALAAVIPNPRSPAV